MNKQEFLHRLSNELACIPDADRQKFLEYYSEMLDDRIEDGMSEAEAVAEMGMPAAIAKQIMLDMPFTAVVKARVKEKRSLAVWEIVLLVLGSPIWLSLLVAAVSVVIAVYVTLWAILISLYAVVFSFAAGGLCSAAFGIVSLFGADAVGAMLFIGAGLSVIGIGGLLLPAVNLAAKGTVLLTRLIGRGIKSCFIGKRVRES